MEYFNVSVEPFMRDILVIKDLTLPDPYLCPHVSSQCDVSIRLIRAA
jgi:hypothetical protein